MKACPVCFSQINEEAIKCHKCLSFIKPRVNEGQFWGTALMIGGIFIGLISYIWYLADHGDTMILFMRVSVILAYMGFLVYGFGTFLSWFRARDSQVIESRPVSTGKKRCGYCAEEIDERAIKCTYCLSYQRQEKGKILATFIVVSGILVLTTAYIMLLARNFQSALYMQVGIVIIFAGVAGFLLIVIRSRYSSKHAGEFQG